MQNYSISGKYARGKRWVAAILADKLSLEGLYLGGGVGALGTKVELDLGLRSGRTHGHDVAGGVVELKYVALRKTGFFRLVVVYDLHKRTAGDFLGRACAVIGHNLLDFLCAGFTLAYDVHHFFHIQAVLLVNFLEELPQGETLLCGPGCAFCNGAARYLGAFVTDEGTEVEAVGFFTAACLPAASGFLRCI